MWGQRGAGEQPELHERHTELHFYPGKFILGISFRKAVTSKCKGLCTETSTLAFKQ